MASFSLTCGLRWLPVRRFSMLRLGMWLQKKRRKNFNHLLGHPHAESCFDHDLASATLTSENQIAMPGSHGNGRLVPVAHGCLVAVDHWRWKSTNVPAACFLTHMHADHVAGLSDASALLQ